MKLFPKVIFFRNIHRLIKIKLHLHHSHITGKVLGYTHDFCNTAVVEKTQADIPFTAHNLFSFDLYFFIKAYIASPWCSKSLSIGGTHVTQIDYGNIADEIKLIDSLKFYQKSLGDLASALTDEEKMAVKKLTERFLNAHHYFSTVWPYLSFLKKERILEIIFGAKGVIPYEIIVHMESFFIKSETECWEKTEFFTN